MGDVTALISAEEIQNDKITRNLHSEQAEHVLTLIPLHPAQQTWIEELIVNTMGTKAKVLFFLTRLP